MKKHILTETTKQQLIQLAARLYETEREGNDNRWALHDIIQAGVEENSYAYQHMSDLWWKTNDKWANNIEDLGISANALRRKLGPDTTPENTEEIWGYLKSISSFTEDVTDKPLPQHPNKTSLAAMIRVSGDLQRAFEKHEAVFTVEQREQWRKHMQAMYASLEAIKRLVDEAQRLHSIGTREGMGKNA